MATDKTKTWINGESTLWYSPNAALDLTWLDGESWVLDEYVPAGGGSVVPIIMQQLNQFDGGSLLL